MTHSTRSVSSPNSLSVVSVCVEVRVLCEPEFTLPNEPGDKLCMIHIRGVDCVSCLPLTPSLSPWGGTYESGVAGSSLGALEVRTEGWV